MKSSLIILTCCLALFTQACSAERKVIKQLDNEMPDYTIAREYANNKSTYDFITPISEAKKGDFVAHKNIVYKKLDKRLLHVDLFQPKRDKASSPAPAVLLVHGGGWRTGDRTHQIPLAQSLAEAGYVGVAIEYRLSREALYPAGVLDIQDAIRWLRAHHKRYNIDPSRIAILGASSGAQMATLVGAAGHLEQFAGHSTRDGDIDSSVQAIINMDGVVDITTPEARQFEDKPGKVSYFALWLGGRYKEYPGLWHEASASTYAGKETPPTLFINSAHDRFHVGRDEFVSVLASYGTYTEVHTIPDTPHTFWLFHPWFDTSKTLVINFLDKVFKSSATHATR